MQQIKQIIFDLGGVLLNIDYNKTSTAFKALGFTDFDQMFSQFTANHLFENLETGNISNEDFLQEIIQSAPMPVTPEQVTDAWNAMLLDFRTGSLDLLDSLARKYKLYLFSNTNNIHLECFRGIFRRETGKPLLDAYFNKAYYSHLIGLRKPYRAAFDFVINDAGINAADTLFIDDSIHNIEGAREAGLHTHLLLPGQLIEELGL
jgi:putative hydrolase of the HAD superfamily